MPCDNRQTQTTRKKNKDGDLITTHTSKRVCANDVEDIREEKIEPILKDFETLVYPPSIRDRPDFVEVVVMDSRTGKKYLRKIPSWAVEQAIDPEQIKVALMPEDTEIKEFFRRYL